jgi:hypothetical protein
MCLKSKKYIQTKHLKITNFHLQHMKSDRPDVASCKSNCSNSLTFPCFEINRSQSVDECSVYMRKSKSLNEHPYGRCFGTVLCSKWCVGSSYLVKLKKKTPKLDVLYFHYNRSMKVLSCEKWELLVLCNSWNTNLKEPKIMCRKHNPAMWCRQI